jgi:hypothetical protein
MMQRSLAAVGRIKADESLFCTYSPPAFYVRHNASMPKLYNYVGPDEFRSAAARSAGGKTVRSVDDIAAWVSGSGQQPDASGQIVATFVVDDRSDLRIADRRSEHVACAGGGTVMSAGEISFDPEQNFEITQISNQSTGYCPEPESWPSVEQALRLIGIRFPEGFTTTCVFRLCRNCGQRSIVKDECFTCDVCGHALPTDWNFA